jgi:hypothetical protein
MSERLDMRKWMLGAVMALAAAMLIGGTALAAGAYANKVTYSGQGLIADGFGGYDLQTETCGIANGADVNGPYLLFVLTATGATKADITIDTTTTPMVKSGNGTFKYVSTWLDPAHLPVISASYDGKSKNAQLVISHGCRPYTHGAWCSPGFWRNADAGAWALTGYARTDLFNSTVVPSFYDTASGADPTLDTVLTTPGANTFGAASGPYGLNAFNATGAFLTDNIPGYDFDLSFMQLDDSQTCPIDHHGNFK